MLQKKWRKFLGNKIKGMQNAYEKYSGPDNRELSFVAGWMSCEASIGTCASCRFSNSKNSRKNTYDCSYFDAVMAGGDFCSKYETR